MEWVDARWNLLLAGDVDPEWLGAVRLEVLQRGFAELGKRSQSTR